MEEDVTYAKQMLEIYTRDFNVEADLLAPCIDACQECAQACTVPR